MTIHTRTTPQGRPLAPFAMPVDGNRRDMSTVEFRSILTTVLDALRAEDEQTRRESARLAEIIARISGVRS